MIAHRRHDDGGGHHTEDANSGDGFVVKLSLANWLGIIGLLLGQLGGAFTAYMSLQNRVVVTEQKNGEQDSTLARHETSIEKLKDRN